METEPYPSPTAFEIALLDALLEGDHPYLALLREQRAKASTVSREWSSAGEFLTFSIPADAPRASPRNFEIGDVYFEIDGFGKPGGGAVLFIRNGVIDFLETYAYNLGDFPAPGTEPTFVINYYGCNRNLDHLQSELEWRQRGMPPDSIPEHRRPSRKL